MAHGPVTAAEMEGAKWVSAPCWHNCGGRCLNKALVKDGQILRMKTDDTHEDSYDWPQARGCLMGRAHQQLVYNENRILHPMKRKHWEPGGGNRELRGIDEFEQISWDEALTYATDELKKAYDEYGPRSILFMSMMGGEGYLSGVLAKMGGFVDMSGTQSIGAFGLNTQLYGMNITLTAKAVNDRYDHRNSDYIVLFGLNAAWCAFGQPAYYLKQAKKDGVKFVYIGPDYSVTAGFTNAEWIPVRPGTDTALLLAVAYDMVDRDEDGSFVDWDFLDRCTVGFDADHMPADAKTDENFIGYLKGEYDGIPKTPEWASEICGTPVEKIHRLTDIMSCQNNVAIHSTSSPSRNEGAENYPQALLTVACMGGHIGKPGNACSDDQYYGAFNSGPALALQLPVGPSWFLASAMINPIDDVISMSVLWDAVLDGKYWNAGHSMAYQFKKGEWRDLDIHVIISEHHNFLQSQCNVNKGIAAFRKVDFVMATAYYWKADAQYADIVFPVATRWERRSPLMYNSAGKDRELAFANDKVIEPQGESRSDYEIVGALAEKLGFNWKEMAPDDEKQMWFKQIATTMVMEPDGQYVPLVTVTEETLKKYDVQGDVVQGKIDFDQFLEDGVYRVKRSEGDAYYNMYYSEFVNDPEGHPLETTASGKFEIYCQAKSDMFDNMNGYADGGEGACDFVRVSPLPKYLPQKHGYKETFADWDNKVKGEYPIQMTHAHYLRRAHTELDQLPWLREAMTNRVFIAKQDAEERGIADGDVIEVFNENGCFLRPATVSRTLMPGVIIVPHGANFRIDTETGIDTAGADNMLTDGRSYSSPFLDAWNSTLVNYRKYEGSIELLPDCEVAPIVPKMA